MFLNVFTASTGSNHYILFAINIVSVLPCGGPKTHPRPSSIVQVIFSLDPLGSVRIFGVFLTDPLIYILLTLFESFGPSLI